jgi:hypothetical protein
MMLVRAMKSAWRMASGWLVLLALVLPFERQTAVLHVAGVSITNVELVLYLLLILYGAVRVSSVPNEGGAAGRGVDAVVLTFGAVAVFAALLAPVHRAEAVRFALRGLSGALLFVAARGILSISGARRTVAQAVTFGAAVSALTALAEAASPCVAAALLAFKSTTFTAGSALRTSGTLEYPTIAAMYWEAAIPFALAVTGSTLLGRLAGAGTAVLLGGAIVSSGSRAGIALGGAIFLIAAAGRGTRRTALLAMVGIVLATAVAAVVVGPPALLARVVPRARPDWYQAEITAAGPRTLETRAGETLSVDLRLRNTGALVWPATGAHALSLLHVWTVGEGQTAVSVGQTSLASDVRPGAEMPLRVELRAPATGGLYRISWRLAQGGLAWDTHDTLGLEVRVGPGPALAHAAPHVELPPLQREPSRLELWRAGLHLFRQHPLLGVGPDNFRHLYDRELGPKTLDDRVHANSLYVETLADTGLLGLAALALVMATLFRTAPPVTDEVGRAARLGLGAFLVHGVVDQFLPFTPTLGLFWLVAALLASSGAQGPDR